MGSGQGGVESGKTRSVFRRRHDGVGDPLALSRIDDSPGVHEERWVTLGRAAAGRLYLVVHTYIELNDDKIAIRIISARRPTRREVRQYEEGGLT